MPDDTPTIDEVQQADYPSVSPVVPVDVTNVVRVDVVPCRSGGISSVRVGAVEPVKLLPGDPRRKSATVVSLDSDLFLGDFAGQVLPGVGASRARWPAGVPWVSERSDEVWALAAAASDVTVIIEHWAR
jgi:hypothetical protein